MDGSCALSMEKNGALTFIGILQLTGQLITEGLIGLVGVFVLKSKEKIGQMKINKWVLFVENCVKCAGCGLQYYIHFVGCSQCGYVKPGDKGF